MKKKLFEEHYEIDCSGIVNHCDLSKTHRTELKNVLKKLLYSVMSKDTGKELPWGNLTEYDLPKFQECCLNRE